MPKPTLPGPGTQSKHPRASARQALHRGNAARMEAEKRRAESSDTLRPQAGALGGLRSAAPPVRTGMRPSPPPVLPAAISVAYATANALSVALAPVVEPHMRQPSLPSHSDVLPRPRGCAAPQVSPVPTLQCGKSGAAPQWLPAPAGGRYTSVDVYTTQVKGPTALRPVSTGALSADPTPPVVADASAHGKLDPQLADGERSGASLRALERAAMPAAATAAGELGALPYHESLAGCACSKAAAVLATGASGGSAATGTGAGIGRVPSRGVDSCGVGTSASTALVAAKSLTPERLARLEKRQRAFSRRGGTNPSASGDTSLFPRGRTCAPSGAADVRTDAAALIAARTSLGISAGGDFRKGFGNLQHLLGGSHSADPSWRTTTALVELAISQADALGGVGYGERQTARWRHHGEAEGDEPPARNEVATVDAYRPAAKSAMASRHAKGAVRGTTGAVPTTSGTQTTRSEADACRAVRTAGGVAARRLNDGGGGGGSGAEPGEEGERTASSDAATAGAPVTPKAGTAPRANDRGGAAVPRRAEARKVSSDTATVVTRRGATGVTAAPPRARGGGVGGGNGCGDADARDLVATSGKPQGGVRRTGRDRPQEESHARGGGSCGGGGIGAERRGGERGSTQRRRRLRETETQRGSHGGETTGGSPTTPSVTVAPGGALPLLPPLPPPPPPLLPFMPPPPPPPFMSMPAFMQFMPPPVMHWPMSAQE